jgi:hypothetical protein
MDKREAFNTKNGLPFDKTYFAQIGVVAGLGLTPICFAQVPQSAD